MGDWERVVDSLFWVPVFVLLLAVVGVIWSPVAALICALVAHFRKLEGEGYAASGATLSALLVLPWVYLLAKMLFRRSIPVFVVAPAYVLVYAVWLLIYVGVFNVGSVIWTFRDMIWTGSQPVTSAVFFVIMSVMLPLNVYTLWVSMRGLRNKYAADRERPHQPVLGLPDFDYLAPFIWLIVWSFVVLLLIVVAGIAAYGAM
ncbi:MAG: hypothetical protein OXK21_06595 [Chloroflexota bacterium]|nr:hypothetical protein [Chloroflexota bacterium]